MPGSSREHFTNITDKEGTASVSYYGRLKRDHLAVPYVSSDWQTASEWITVLTVLFKSLK